MCTVHLLTYFSLKLWVASSSLRQRRSRQNKGQSMTCCQNKQMALWLGLIKMSKTAVQFPRDVGAGGCMEYVCVCVLGWEREFTDMLFHCVAERSSAFTENCLCYYMWVCPCRLYEFGTLIIYCCKSRWFWWLMIISLTDFSEYNVIIPHKNGCQNYKNKIQIVINQNDPLKVSWEHC